MGVVTNRDMSMEFGTRNEHASWLRGGTVMRRKVVAGKPADGSVAALAVHDVAGLGGAASDPGMDEALATQTASCGHRRRPHSTSVA